MVCRQSLADELGVTVGRTPPLAGVEARPVAVVAAGNAVDADVQQRDFLARCLRLVDGWPVAQPDSAPTVGEGHAIEHVAQASRVVTGIYQILDGI